MCVHVGVYNDSRTFKRTSLFNLTLWSLCNQILHTELSCNNSNASLVQGNERMYVVWCAIPGAPRKKQNGRVSVI